MQPDPQKPASLIQKSRHRIGLRSGLLLALAVVLVLVSVWLVAAMAAPSWLRRAAPVADPQALAELTQRCQAEMLRGTCSAMNSSAPKAGASRLFIAGVGEVDAAAFAALRAAGNQMCAEAATACSKDWNGNTCRVTRALYPLPGAGAGGRQ